MKEAHLKGTVQEFTALLKNNKTAFTDKNLSVTNIITDLTNQAEDLVEKGDEQDSLKRQLKDKTAETTTAAERLYDTFSTTVDAAAGAVGKKTNLGKQENVS